MSLIINIWWRQICWFLLPYWIQSPYNIVLLIFDTSSPTSQLVLEVLHPGRKQKLAHCPWSKCSTHNTAQLHVPLPGTCETISFLRLNWSPALFSALEETAGITSKTRWSMKCKIQKTYHSHPLQQFLMDVIDKAVCYKFHFVNASFEVLEYLASQDNALSHEKPCHFVNTNRHTLLTSIFFLIIHFSSVLHSFLSNEMVLYDHNCNCFPTAGGVLEEGCKMSASKVVN